MERQRIVAAEGGEISYILSKKPIKNLNLRVTNSGEVFLSVPEGCTTAQADEFIKEKRVWIRRHIGRQKEKSEILLLPQRNRKECYEILMRDVEQVYPLVEKRGVSWPELKIRNMRSQWGNCHWSQGYITLNVALHRCPEHLRCYVALHELVHFIHHDHGTGFYALMDEFMPDWRERRKELKKYVSAIQR